MDWVSMLPDGLAVDLQIRKWQLRIVSRYPEI
jgi:hypothetical protein